MTRYYINNFTDGYYHDCLDVCGQKLIPGKDKFKKRAGVLSMFKLSVIFFILMASLVQYAVKNHILHDVVDPTWKHQAVLFGSVVGTLLAGVYFIVNNGRYFIDDSTRFV